MSGCVALLGRLRGAKFDWVRVRVTAAALAITLLLIGLVTAPAISADQCSPPGVESTSSLPTNLAKAAKGPDEDKYTTESVEPLNAVNVSQLGLGTPGTLVVGTLSDAPPSVCINSAGQFTGFDNELLRAVADKLGLRVQFVGTDFSGLLRRSRRVVSTSARRRSPPPMHAGRRSGSPTATTSATSRSSSRLARRSPVSTSWRRANASAWFRAPCKRLTSSTPCTWTR